MTQGICLICAEYFERDDKDRKRLGCGDCGETAEQMAKSMFLSKRQQTVSDNSLKDDTEGDSNE